MKRIVSMSSPDHQLLIHWFTTIDASRFRRLVRRLLQFITIREFPPANGVKLPPVTKSRWWIPSATRILALLHASNCKINPNIIAYTEFYNSALDHINLMAEYHKWQNPSAGSGNSSGTSSRSGGSRFSYCQYPFILSIVAKKMILQKDSEQQMILNARVSG
jgi:E3 ubiquitin-protein ligase HECTD2